MPESSDGIHSFCVEVDKLCTHVVAAIEQHVAGRFVIVYQVGFCQFCGACSPCTVALGEAGAVGGQPVGLKEVLFFGNFYDNLVSIGVDYCITVL